jgi:phosphoenolpyruvate phosphomutase
MNAAAARLRASLAGPRIVRLAGAHNALGGRLVERAGFDGIWASSLEACASRGVPDDGGITLRECLASASAIASAVTVPVVADCDSGFGDESAVRELVCRFEAAGIAGVSIEDQPAAKTNSLAPGPHALVPTGLFATKLQAAKLAQRGPEFLIIARTEALIAGLGTHEALARARAYAAAGADAVLVHSKARTSSPIDEFLAQWDGAVPIVVVPTTYPDCTAAEFERMGVRMVIYANHGLRAAIRAMEEAFATIIRDGCTRSIEGAIASVDDVFGLQVARPSGVDRCA